MEQQLSDKQIKELSAQNPHEIFTAEDGRMAFHGMLFKDEAELTAYIRLLSSKPSARILKLLKAIQKVFGFFRKPLKRKT